MNEQTMCFFKDLQRATERALTTHSPNGGKEEHWSSAAS